MAFVLFALITTAAIASIVVPCVIVSGIFISLRVTATIVVHVFAVIAGSGFRAVVPVGCHFVAGVCIIKRRFCVRFLVRSVRCERSLCLERAVASAS